MGVNYFPDFPLYLLMAAAFARRLRLYGGYESEDHVGFILNVEANCFRDYFRRSADLPAGVEALNLFEECVRITNEPLDKAFEEHNVAMAIYSMLAKFPEEIVCVVTLRLNLRLEGIAAAKRALNEFKRYDEAPLKTQCARVEFLIGDLLRVGKASANEIGESITYYDKALNSGALPDNMQLHVREARGITLSGIASIGPELLAKAINDLNLVVKKSETDRVWSDKYGALLTLARLHLRQNNLKDATELMEHAAALAVRELEIISDEVTLFQRGNIHAPVFEELAGCYAKANRGEEALKALETVRAPTLRLHTMDSVESLIDKGKTLEAAFARTNKAILLRTENLVELQKLQLQPVKGHIDQLCSVLTGVPTALVSFMLRADQVTALIVLPTERAGRQIHSVQFEHDPRIVNEAIDSLFLLQDPTPLRESRLVNLCRAMFEILISPIMPILSENGIRRIAISPPGGMTHLPFEALFHDTSANPLADSFDLFYLPSIRIGADLVAAVASSSPGKLLAVSYADKDLPETKREIENLRNIWKDRVVLLDSERCTKREVIDELKNNYDYLHFSCHGSFDVLDPLNSALHLVANPQRDNQRLTARDILSIKFPSRPVVTMSACSTALTAATKANDYTGLTGSLLRAGARAIVGSRWPVYDDTAADFMIRLYERLYDAKRTPYEDFLDVQKDMRKSYPTEDWAAFGYLGLP